MDIAEELKFSIIIPVYNVEKYLKKCLDSIANQTFKNFEVICVNDGSTDNSGEILKDYAAKDKRFVIINQQNQGPGIARNNALDILRGEYIVFVDPDDWLELNALTLLKETFEKTKVDVVEFNHYQYNEYAGKIYECNHAETMKDRFGLDLIKTPYYNYEDLNNFRCGMAAWLRSYKNQFLKKIKARFGLGKYYEDHIFSQIVILNAEKIYYLNEYLYNHCVRKESLVNTVSDMHFCVFSHLEAAEEYLISHNLYNKVQDAWRGYVMGALPGAYLRVYGKKLFKAKCREILTTDEYKEFLKRIHEKRYAGYSVMERLFSVKSRDILGIPHKIITVFWFQIKIKKHKK